MCWTSCWEPHHPIAWKTFLDHGSPNILYLFVLRKNGKLKKATVVYYSCFPAKHGLWESLPPHLEVLHSRSTHNRQAMGFNIYSYESDCMNAWILKFLIVCMCMRVWVLCHFPSENCPDTDSMLMYSCLHLTLNMLWLIIITQDERSVSPEWGAWV